MAHKVFAIPELLEQILSHLAPADLFLLQRTSHAWRALIATSPTLQQKMFLRARPTSSTSPVHFREIEVNKLVFPDLYPWPNALVTYDCPPVHHGNRNMFTTQSPTTRAIITVDVHNPVARAEVVETTGGIRLGDVIAIVENIVKQTLSGCVCAVRYTILTVLTERGSDGDLIRAAVRRG